MLEDVVTTQVEAGAIANNQEISRDTPDGSHK